MSVFLKIKYYNDFICAFQIRQLKVKNEYIYTVFVIKCNNNNIYYILQYNNNCGY